MRSYVPFARHAVGVSLLSLFAVACLGDTEPNIGIPSNPATETYAASLGVNIAGMTRKSDALFIQDVTVGTGAEVAVGTSVRVTYTGWLINGTRFDTNVGGTPYPVLVGEHRVIDGWEQGLVGMRIGGKRRLVIGSALAYGSAGSYPVIPPNATLVFDVQLIP